MQINRDRIFFYATDKTWVISERQRLYHKSLKKDQEKEGLER